MAGNDINKDIKEFVSGINRGPLKSLIVNGNTISLDNITHGEDIFELVVEQVWLDMCRTLTNNKNKSVAKQRVEAKQLLAERLKYYFDKSPKKKENAFDGWYFEVNSDVCNCGNLKIGQAQKLINMAFKYLYCCKEFRENKHDHFVFSHMPLDGYILKWYKREVDKEYDGQAWSKINDVSKYLSIEQNIRNYFMDEIVLEKEFSLWMEEKKKAEIKTQISYADKIIKSPECGSELKKLLSDYQEQLKTNIQ